MAQYTIDTVVNRLDDIYTILDIIAEKVEEVSFDDVVSEIRDLKNVVISRPAVAAAAGTGTSGSGNGSNGIPNDFYSNVVDFLKDIKTNTSNVNDIIKKRKSEGESPEDESKKTEEEVKASIERLKGLYDKLPGVKDTYNIKGIVSSIKSIREYNQAYEEFASKFPNHTGPNLGNISSIIGGGGSGNNTPGGTNATNTNPLNYQRQSTTAAVIAVGDQIVDVLKNLALDVVEIINTGIEMQINELKTTQAIVGRELQFMGHMLNKSVDIAFRSVFAEDLNAVMFDAYRNMLDLSAENVKRNLQDQASLLDYQKRSIELNNQMVKNVAKVVGGIGGGMAATGVGAAVGAGVAIAGGVAVAVSEVYSKIRIKQLDKAKTEFEGLEKAVTEMTDTAVENAKLVTQLAQDAHMLLAKVDDNAKKLGRTMGLSGENLQQFRNSLIDVATNSMISVFGGTAEDLVKIQQAYQGSSDRNLMLSTSEYENTMAMSKITGIDEEEVASMVGDMYKFNIAAEQGNDIMFEIYKNAAKMGLNTTKAVKEFSNNLKLASKVNFKGGVEGIKEMTTWAMKVRFNMESLGSMVDKIISGGLEGVMESAAKLSVIGGNASMYADPLGILYGAIDAQDLAERLYNSISDIGTYNRETGWTDFNLYDRQRMKVIGEAYGKSPEELDVMIRTQKQRADVERALRGTGLSPKEMDLVNAHAKFNIQTGKWETQLLNRENPVDISTLKPEDLKNLVSNDTDEALVQYAASNLSQAEKQTEAQTDIKNMLAKGSVGAFDTATSESIKATIEFGKGNKESLLTAARTTIEQSAESLKKTYQIAAKSIEEGGVFFQLQKKMSEDLEASLDAAGNLAIKFANVTEALAKGDIEGAAKILGITVTTYVKEMNKIREEKETQAKAVKTIEPDAQASLAKANISTINFHDGFVTYPQTLITSPNSTVTKVNDGAVAFHKDDQIIAAKPGGGIYEMIRNTYDNISKMVQSPPSLQIPRNDVYRAEITVKLESKDGKVDITSIVRDTDGMRMITDMVLQTIAQKKTAFWINSNEI